MPSMNINATALRKRQGIYYHQRAAYRGEPAGITVSRRRKLPQGDFRITEYCWGTTSLWFVEADNFTDDEREAAYRHWGAMQCNP